MARAPRKDFGWPGDFFLRKSISKAGWAIGIRIFLGFRVCRRRIGRWRIYSRLNWRGGGWLARLSRHTCSRISWQSIRGFQRMNPTRGRSGSGGPPRRDSIDKPDLMIWRSGNTHFTGSDTSSREIWRKNGENSADWLRNSTTSRTFWICR